MARTKIVEVDALIHKEHADVYITKKVGLPPSCAAELSNNPELRRRQLTYIGLCPYQHHYKMARALKLIAQGWGDVFLVDTVRRGSLGNLTRVPEAERYQYTIEIRPSRSGKYSKPCVLRAVRDAAEMGRLGVRAPAPMTEEEKVAADLREYTTPARLPYG